MSKDKSSTEDKSLFNQILDKINALIEKDNKSEGVSDDIKAAIQTEVDAIKAEYDKNIEDLTAERDTAQNKVTQLGEDLKAIKADVEKAQKENTDLTEEVKNLKADGGAGAGNSGDDGRGKGQPETIFDSMVENLKDKM